MKTIQNVPLLGIGARNPYQRILVVEDDAAVRKMIVRMLIGFGYHVDTAEDGLAGWDALQVGNYDLVMTDHDMPRMSGIELVKKARIARMTLPAVLVSGAVPAEELQLQPRLRFGAILSKPFSTQELLATIHEVLSRPEGGRLGAESSTVIPYVDASRFTQSRHTGINE